MRIFFRETNARKIPVSWSRGQYKLFRLACAYVWDSKICFRVIIWNILISLMSHCLYHFHLLTAIKTWHLIRFRHYMFSKIASLSSVLSAVCCFYARPHYDDVIMTMLASQITSLTVVYSIVYSELNQTKHQSSASLAFVREIHRDRWISRTNGQLRGKCFHLMTSSCCLHVFHLWMR